MVLLVHRTPSPKIVVRTDRLHQQIDFERQFTIGLDVTAVSIGHLWPNQSLQPTANPLRGLPVTELGC